MSLPTRNRMEAQAPLPGRLIAVEGLDGSGKSTQVRLLHNWLDGLGCRVFLTEWNSSELVRGATKKGKKRQSLTPTTFSLIHATDFADRYERQILPMLQAGCIVLCDRYVFTSFARDGVRGCDPTWVEELYGFARIPDLVLYFRLDLEIALGRILQGRPELKYFEAGMDLGLSKDPEESFRLFQGRVKDQYDRMSQAFGFTVVEAGSGGVFAQQAVVRRLVAERITLSQFRKGGL